MVNFFRNHKVISGVILVNVIAVICLVVAIIIHNNKTATIDIVVAPNDAKILINGQSYNNYSSVDLLPGNYKAEISMDGMQTRTVDFSLGDGAFYRLYAYLLDDSGSFKYYNTRPDEVGILETIMEFNTDDRELSGYVEKFNRVYGILDVLPLYRSGEGGVYIEQAGTGYDDDNNMVIDTSNCDEIVCLEVYGNNKELANKLITEAGYNPDDYTINYGGDV